MAGIECIQLVLSFGQNSLIDDLTRWLKCWGLACTNANDLRSSYLKGNLVFVLLIEYLVNQLLVPFTILGHLE